MAQKEKALAQLARALTISEEVETEEFPRVARAAPARRVAKPAVAVSAEMAASPLEAAVARVSTSATVPIARLAGSEELLREVSEADATCSSPGQHLQ